MVIMFLKNLHILRQPKCLDLNPILDGLLPAFCLPHGENSFFTNDFRLLSPYSKSHPTTFLTWYSPKASATNEEAPEGQFRI